MSKTNRVTDQILILQSIQCVREELALMVVEYGYTDLRVEADIMERLTSLYACLNVESIANTLKDINNNKEITHDRRKK